MTVPFHETRMGHSFYERDVPKIAKALDEIAEQLRQLNEHLRTRKEPDDDEG
jgi:DNA-binding ferritin-like protein